MQSDSVQVNKHPVSEKYKSLFHYTSVGGLNGILKSKSLWATNALYLNDATEIKIAQNFLEERLFPITKEILGKITEADPKALEKMNLKYGGLEQASRILSSNHVASLYRGFYKATLGIFITSFCSHDDDSYVYENGLLSQWRGYGQGGGYAIEFDTKDLESLNQKIGQIQELSGTFAAVAYEHKVKDQAEEIDWFLNHLNQVFGTTEQFMSALWLDKNEEKAFDILGEQYDHFFKVISLLKHRAFSEEKEVRIVYAPIKVSSEYEEICAANEQEPSEEVEVSCFERNGKLIPYVSLYADLAQDPDFRLPIKRIIVGPHLDKDSRAAALQSLVAKHNIKVTVSDIPYIP